MYFFNQGQALEQYYINTRNTIQLRANSHVDQFYIHRRTDPFGHGTANAVPLLCIGDVKELFKGQRGENVSVQVKTSVGKITPSLFWRIIKSDMQMELENKSLFRLMPHSHYMKPTGLNKLNK